MVKRILVSLLALGADLCRVAARWFGFDALQSAIRRERSRQAYGRAVAEALS